MEHTKRILTEIEFERIRQLQEYSPERDDQRATYQWNDLIQRHWINTTTRSDEMRRALLVNMATLCVAAIESFDRKQERGETEPPREQYVSWNSRATPANDWTTFSHQQGEVLRAMQEPPAVEYRRAIEGNFVDSNNSQVVDNREIRGGGPVMGGSSSTTVPIQMIGGPGRTTLTRTQPEDYTSVRHVDGRSISPYDGMHGWNYNSPRRNAGMQRYYSPEEFTRMAQGLADSEFNTAGIYSRPEGGAGRRSYSDWERTVIEPEATPPDDTPTPSVPVTFTADPGSAEGSFTVQAQAPGHQPSAVQRILGRPRTVVSASDPRSYTMTARLLDNPNE